MGHDFNNLQRLSPTDRNVLLTVAWLGPAKIGLIAPEVAHVSVDKSLRRLRELDLVEVVDEESTKKHYTYDLTDTGRRTLRIYCDWIANDVRPRLGDNREDVLPSVPPPQS